MHTNSLPLNLIVIISFLFAFFLMAAATPRLLIVGAGISGATTAALLRTTLSSSELSITVWDKSRGAGGRMSTSRSSTDARMHVDLGAQYITVDAGGGNALDAQSPFHYDNLLRQNLLIELTGNIENTRDGHDSKLHYAAPRGISSLVKHFIGDTHVEYNRRVSSIDKTHSAWKVTDTEKNIEQFDAVVLSIPAAQALGIGGNVRHFLNNDFHGKKLNGVQFSSRWALGIYYPFNAWPAIEQAPWVARYVRKDEDDALVWLSLESKKRGFLEGSEGGPGPVVVAHCGVPWSLKHSGDTREEILNQLLPKIGKFLPKLTEDGVMPVGTKLIHWKYSQVRPGTEVGAGFEAESFSALNVDTEENGPLLIVAGDSIAGSNFENCVRSGKEAAEMVNRWLSSRHHSDVASSSL